MLPFMLFMPILRTPLMRVGNTRYCSCWAGSSCWSQNHCRPYVQVVTPPRNGGCSCRSGIEPLDVVRAAGRHIKLLMLKIGCLILIYLAEALPCRRGCQSRPVLPAELHRLVLIWKPPKAAFSQSMVRPWFPRPKGRAQTSSTVSRVGTLLFDGSQLGNGSYALAK